MPWRKAWLETRWRFLIGFGLLVCSAATNVFTDREGQKLIPLVPTNIGGVLGERIRESADLAREYRGFVWSNWFRQNASQIATLFAILLGTAGVLSYSGGALFTLSLPVSRPRLLSFRAATGLAELFVLASIPVLVIPLLAPSIGESYPVGSALIHGVCLFVAVSVFFNLAFLLSTVFDDPWRPLLIALVIAFALSLVHQVFRPPLFDLFRVMSGERYFRSGRLPWEGLVASLFVSAALYYAAVLNFARRDF